MARLIDWINELADGEQIEAVMIGPVGGWCPGFLSDDAIDAGVVGKVLTLDEARPWLERKFDDGYGSAECNSLAAYTKTWIISVNKYDGSTSPFRLARNPFEGFEPPMPGGG